jgi:hypothetical protein
MRACGTLPLRRNVSAGAGEEHARRRAGPTRARESGGRREDGAARRSVTTRRIRCQRVFADWRDCARERERATPPLLRACAATAIRVRAPAKSTSGAARKQLARAAARWPRSADPRRRPAAEAREVSAVRLSRHVDAACAGALVGNPQRRESPGTLTLECPSRLTLGLHSDSESGNSREKFAVLPARS